MDNQTDTSPVPYSRIESIVGARDAALAKMEEAAALIARGHALADEAAEIARAATGGRSFYLVDRTKNEEYRSLFRDFNADAAFKCYRHHLDASTWTNLVEISGIASLMDRTAKEALDKDLSGDVPPVTVEAVQDTLSALVGDASLIFQRGLARCFIDLDKRFKSHDAFQIGDRIILTHVFDQWGCLNYNGHMRETLYDVERTFAVLDGAKPAPGVMLSALEASRRGGGMQPRQSYLETEYFRIRCYKNGNAHLWFRRDDLVEKANQVLADYYGAVLPDAVPKGADLKSTALSTDLAFYPTPKAAVGKLLRDVTPRGRVLEPSAGDGAIVEALLASGKATQVTAVEVHPGRVATLRQRFMDPRLHVLPANFLELQPTGDYDLVVMNPPFAGTHWMAHVVHAWEFLKPSGTLLAVLPATAEVGTSAKHAEFHAWIEARRGRYSSRPWTSLPPESFAASGTRVNTVILRLDKGL